MREASKEIFISYRCDGSGNNFAARLYEDLVDMGYSVYFDPNENYATVFPAHIQDAIAACTDFVLIISDGCLNTLIEHPPIDWVREEILIAQKYEKNIIPIIMENVNIPKDNTVLSEELRFILHLPAIKFPEKYVISPLSILIGKLNAKQIGVERYRDVFSSNPRYNIREDYEGLLCAAREGSVEAMYELGMMGFYGVTNSEGTEAFWNYEQAAHWLKMVAESDHELKAHAQSTLGRMYYHGTVPREPQSYEKAFQYHKMACQQDRYSAVDVGFMLRAGIGCTFDFDEILDYYSKIQINDQVQMMALAKFLTQYGRYEEAFDLYDSMTDISPEASYQIGLLYRDGVLSDPPKPNYRLAAGYFKDAADEKHIAAAYEYGVLCFRPSGRLPKDFKKAEKYLKMAADGGHSGAQYVLGFMYRHGHVKKDLKLALEYLEKARYQGNSLASLELASLYQHPECQNFQRAFECAQYAASHGVAEAHLILGNLLFWGRDCEADMNKAYEMYSIAYDRGMFYASVMMEKIDRLTAAD